MAGEGVLRLRLERLADRRQELLDEIKETIHGVEMDNRFVSAAEEERLNRRREELKQVEREVVGLADDLERMRGSMEVSRLVRGDSGEGHRQGLDTYRTFAQYARDAIIARDARIADRVAGEVGNRAAVQELAVARIERAVQHTLSSNVAGLVAPAHVAQIMDVIDASRPVVASARRLNLSSGKLTYPEIVQRPEVLKQATEKTEAGTANMQVTLGELPAETYLGAGNLSWQSVNWSSPDALDLWFQLAAEAYARKTETAAGAELGTVAIGTISPVLGTAGTESFDQWRAAVLSGVGQIYTATGGRANTNTLYVSSTRFFQLAGLSSTSPLQLSAVGKVNVASLSGTFAGLRVIGSYGLSGNQTIIGDSSALLVGETAGAPVELRAVEPSIGGYEVGVIGAFKAKVFDADRFVKLNG